MAEKVTLTCTECFSRNYSTSKNKKTSTQRLEMRKFLSKMREAHFAPRNEIEGKIMSNEKKKNGRILQKESGPN